MRWRENDEKMLLLSHLGLHLHLRRSAVCNETGQLCVRETCTESGRTEICVVFDKIMRAKWLVFPIKSALIFAISPLTFK